ncbi:hypothetical protein D3C86_1541920 [compost metagenome]
MALWPARRFWRHRATAWLSIASSQPRLCVACGSANFASCARSVGPISRRAPALAATCCRIFSGIASRTAVLATALPDALWASHTAPKILPMAARGSFSNCSAATPACVRADRALPAASSRPSATASIPPAISPSSLSPRAPASSRMLPSFACACCTKSSSSPMMVAFKCPTSTSINPSPRAAVAAWRSS